MVLRDGEEAVLVHDDTTLGRVFLHSHHAGAVRLRLDFPRAVAITRRELL